MDTSNALRALIDKLDAAHRLTETEYETLFAGRAAVADYAAALADARRREIYGTDVYIRGLIEVSNICKNDCYYCGIRKSNAACTRYRLGDDEILAACRAGYALGFRTFVMQGGEDAAFSDARLVPLVRAIKAEFPDCAVTLSLGERPDASYRALREAGADRYLLRHETADAAHYARLHPAAMSHGNRLHCLAALRTLGYQVGCGFMVGSPYQTAAHVAKDLKFIETFRPDMVGIGPFIPHHATPFAAFPPGTAEATIFLLSLVRLMLPGVLLPATTALGTIEPDGRARGIAAGANVVMPNLSPAAVRGQYTLYDGKQASGAEAAECVRALADSMAAIGYTVVTARGDVKR